VQRLFIPGLFFCAAMAPAIGTGAPAHDTSNISLNGSPSIQPPSGAATGTVTGSLTGTVLAAESRWDGPGEHGGRIVTHVTIELADGSIVSARQPGGTVGDIGMVQFPGPPLLRAGDHVEARVARFASGGRWSILDVTSLARAPAPEAPRLDERLDEKQPGARLLEESPPRRDFVRTMTDGLAPLYWGSGCTYVVFDSQGTAHIEGAREFEIMQDALDHWRASTQSCSYMDFVIEEPRPMEVGFDGFNVVKFRDESWCRPPPAGETEPECHQPNAAGLTTVTFINNTESKRYGEILDADIELNAAVTFSISVDGVTLGPDGRELADLGNTFTHEVGHFLGLDHACRLASEPVRLDHDGQEVPLCSGSLLEATMHPTQDSGETKKASLETDDIQGACDIHPLADDPKRCRAVDLTPERSYCTIAPDGAGNAPDGHGGAGRAGALASLGLLLGAALLLRRKAHR
jgi:hypothetical protein